MFLQQSQNFDSLSSKGIMQIPIGNGLNGGSPTLPVVDGSIALNRSNGQLYYVGQNTWKAATGDLVTLAAVGASPNANGASIVGQVLTLQPANASFPGVVNTLAQTFSGVKSFPNGIIADGTNYTTIAPTAGTAANDGLVINNPANTINLEFADPDSNGIVSTVTQNFAGLKLFFDGVVVGPIAPSVPMTIRLENYAWHNMSTVPVTGGVIGNCVVRVQRVGNFVTLLLSQLTVPNSFTGVATFSTALPVEFRPLVFNRGGSMAVWVYGSYGLGGFEVDTAGTITVGAAISSVFLGDLIPFNIGPGLTGWPGCVVTYSII